MIILKYSIQHIRVHYDIKLCREALLSNHPYTGKQCNEIKFPQDYGAVCKQKMLRGGFSRYLNK